IHVLSGHSFKGYYFISDEDTKVRECIESPNKGHMFKLAILKTCKDYTYQNLCITSSKGKKLDYFK
ncbi:MAG: hypothetical protein WBB17_12675, partial [Saprospiraceae bacterium]